MSHKIRNPRRVVLLALAWFFLFVAMNWRARLSRGRCLPCRPPSLHEICARMYCKMIDCRLLSAHADLTVISELSMREFQE